MLGKLNTQEIEELISNQLVGRIGCYANNMVYIVPLSYAYETPYIYGYTFEGMKIEMMRTNPYVCFEIDDTKDLSNWKSVISWGYFEELTTDDQRNYALQKLNERVLPFLHSETMHISSSWPFTINNIKDTKGIFFRIKLENKTGRFEKNTSDYFYAT